jgi:hypothetical protein
MILMQRMNDFTFSQITEALFPVLRSCNAVVHMLTLLPGLGRQNGPEDEGYACWECWMVECNAEGIHLQG